VAAVIAPKLLGGTPARTPLGELGLQSMDQVQSWQVRRLQHLGPDLLWNLSALR
jgi:diaminohydroxyphosphoribosylaminopyrimidine deaminase/5-amino-6-(5-phosphoribosylamino)uracil reductase